jgi:hypothetical protein
MPKVKHHDPSIDTNIRLLIEKGYTAREIAAESGKSPMTIYDYASDLGLKFKKGKQHHDKELSPKDPNAPPEDPKTNKPDPEEQIKENVTKKHVKDVSEKLATLTVEHELKMREVVVALEKHTAIFESVEEMGMSRVEFIDAAIEVGYENLRDNYLRKMQEYEERKAMKDFLEFRAKIRGSS